MSRIKIMSLFIMLAMLAFSMNSCTPEEITPTEKLAFSSNNGPGIPDISVGGDKTFYKFQLTNGFSQWSDNGVFWLGIIADEKVRAVYIYASTKHTKWMRVDPKFGDGGFNKSFDVDAFMRNRGGKNCGLFNPDKEGLKAFGIGQYVYVTFGGKYARLRRDRGSVFRDSGSGCGSFPKGISCVDYLPFASTADFNGGGVFIGVTKNGYVAGSSTLDGDFLIPGLELGTPNSNSDVNYSPRTAGKVTCLSVVSNKAVDFTTSDGATIRGFAQRGGNEFIKVD